MDLSSIPPEMLPHIPAGVPPNGTTSNLINPPSREGQTKTVMYVSLPIMFVFLVMRLYTRARVTRGFGADDFLAIISAICIGGYCGVLYYMLDGPLGEHVWDVSLASIGAPFQKSNLGSQTLYSLAALFTKITLLVLYLRIFHPSYRANIMIWVGIVVVALAYVAFAIASIIVYVPPPGHPEQWAMTKSAAKTTALLNITAVVGVFGIVSDFYILLIPMHLVVGLHLPLGRKLGVSGIFLTGLSACICSIVGTVYRFQARPSQDPLWDTITAYSLGIIELNVGLICSCLPVLFVFLKRVAKSNSYISLVRYFRTRRSDGISQGQNNDSDHREKSDEIHLTIPKPTMTGLRSFIRKAHRSQPQQSYQLESYNELDSVNDDYHAQLKEAKAMATKRQDLP
ncbi:hypothetical protein BU26DRAFT_609705 [Trematosphaeria pertusa]|uniref:Rhodopsin domain-containing protein n=1 Tax=Trematosphaeria pertusa TaxID=390896 RepID=A0A6A6HXQ2_9PLEO|nr:uncharacterized protein BU26DRAFT_609705 [Trematosphaeria pertusa]KAF2242994.1 hypothetical protein BU26DRAFT_609705 [Trematosphaeria pertusa]